MNKLNYHFASFTFTSQSIHFGAQNKTAKWLIDFEKRSKQSFVALQFICGLLRHFTASYDCSSAGQIGINLLRAPQQAKSERFLNIVPYSIHYTAYMYRYLYINYFFLILEVDQIVHMPAEIFFLNQLLTRKKKQIQNIKNGYIAIHSCTQVFFRNLL